ncbi:MAG: cytochrome c biogenesis protein CcsA [Betaproteobacteria bacterium]|nr:cytochrome c biogenesis protein CcsA [Betaproteobacteria bacterium]
MILLHLAVAALYGLAAWAHWPAAADPSASRDAAPPFPRSLAGWLLPLAVATHAWLALSDIARPEGLDLSIANALSVVAWLTAILAWGSGLLRTLPAVGSIVLPVTAIASLLPAFVVNPHRFPYAGDPLATAHVAVALVAYAMFIIAAVEALILMGLEKRLHRRLPEPGPAGLPPLLTLERFLFRLIGAGFVLLTLTLASGMLFTEQLFGRPFTFTHKSVFSILGWLTFGALLWGRWRYGWRGRVALRWILAGTVFLFLAYLGYKFVLEIILGK